MQLKKSMLILCVFLLTKIFAMQSVRANPILPPLFDYISYYIFIAIIGFLITILIECSVGYSLINSKRIETKSLLKIIIIINMITFPFAQLLGIIFNIFLLPLIIIEIIIIIFEWLLISNSYTKYRNKKFEDALNPKILLFIYTLIANALSLLIGFVVFGNFYPNYLELLI
jgi:hypothetical protein